MNAEYIKDILENLRVIIIESMEEHTKKYNEYTDNTSCTVLRGEQYVVHVGGITREIEGGRIVLGDPLLPTLFSFARACEFANACGGMVEAYDSYLLDQIKEMKESIVTIDRRIKELNTI